MTADFRKLQFGFMPLSERALEALEKLCGFSWAFGFEPVRLTAAQIAALAARGFRFC